MVPPKIMYKYIYIYTVYTQYECWGAQRIICIKFVMLREPSVCSLIFSILAPTNHRPSTLCHSEVLFQSSSLEHNLGIPGMLLRPSSRRSNSIRNQSHRSFKCFTEIARIPTLDAKRTSQINFPPPKFIDSQSSDLTLHGGWLHLST